MGFSVLVCGTCSTMFTDVSLALSHQQVMKHELKEVKIKWGEERKF